MMEKWELNQKSPELLEKIVVKDRKEAVSKILETFKQRLKDRFTFEGRDKNSPEFQEYMDFHGPEHSEEGVMKGSEEFLRVVQSIDPNLVSDEDIDLTKIKALGHDLVQKAITNIPPQRMRVRGAEADGSDIPANVRPHLESGQAVGNEWASAQEVVDELKRYVLPDGTSVFSDDEIKTVHDDISLTFPDFNFSKLPDGTPALEIFQPNLMPDQGIVNPPKDIADDPEKLKQWKENFEEKFYKLLDRSHNVTITGLAIASADLRGELASENPEDFGKGGDSEFREINTQLRNELEDWRGIESKRRAEIVGMVLNWIKTQVGFSKWQRILFMTSVDQNPAINGSPKSEEIKKALFKLYGLHENDAVYLKPGEGRFGDSIRVVQGRYDRLEAKFGQFRNIEKPISDEQFKDILESVGYKLK